MKSANGEPVDPPAVLVASVSEDGGFWLGRVKQVVSQYLLIGGSTLTSRALSFLAVAVLGRLLGPARFGEFSLAFFVMTLLAQLSSAVDAAMVKQIGADQTQERKILFAAFLVKLGLHSSLLFLGLLLAQPIVTWLLGKEGFLPLYLVAVAGGGLMALYNMQLAYYQGRQQFRAYAAWSVGFYLVLFAGVCVINFRGHASALTNLLWIVGLTALAVGFALPRIVTRFAWPEVRPQFQQLIHFGSWLGVATVAAAVHQRLDVFMLNRVANYEDLGHYAAAVRISMIVDLFNQAIMIVLFPKAMRITNAAELRSYARETQLITGLVALGGVLIMLLVTPLSTLLFGPAFAAAAGPARLLCAANILMLAYTPISFLFYNRNRPQLVASLGVFKLVAAITLAGFLIPRLGATGAALTMLFTNGLALVFVVFFARRLILQAGWGPLSSMFKHNPKSKFTAGNPSALVAAATQITARRRQDPVCRLLSALLWRGIHGTLGGPRFLRAYYAPNTVTRIHWQDRPACLLLSFDLDHGEDIRAIPQVLELLKPYNFPATHYCVGSYIAKYPREHDRLLQSGHEIANHTQNHPPNPDFHSGRGYPALTAQQMVDEISQCHQTCQMQLGYTMRGFRAPHFGNQRNPHTHRALAQLGYTYSSSLIATHAPRSRAGLPYRHAGVLEIPVSPSPLNPSATPESYTLGRSAKRLAGDEYLRAFECLLSIGIETGSLLNIYIDPQDIPANAEVFRRLFQLIAKHESQLWIPRNADLADFWISRTDV